MTEKSQLLLAYTNTTKYIKLTKHYVTNKQKQTSVSNHSFCAHAHHKLLRQFVAGELETLRMLWGGYRFPPGHDRPSRQKLVDLVEDFSELRSGVAGDLTDRDGGSFLELQLQFLCLGEIKPLES